MICQAFEGQLDLQRFVDAHVLRTGQQCFAVVDNGRVQGIITPQDVKQLGRRESSHTTVEDVMRPIAQVRTVDPMSSVTEAPDVMSRDRATAKQLFTALAETLNGVGIDLQN